MLKLIIFLWFITDNLGFTILNICIRAAKKIQYYGAIRRFLIKFVDISSARVIFASNFRFNDILAIFLVIP